MSMTDFRFQRRPGGDGGDAALNCPVLDSLSGHGH